jgi:hypothetical protein
MIFFSVLTVFCSLFNFGSKLPVACLVNDATAFNIRGGMSIVETNDLQAKLPLCCWC